jgi:hypothetical protein
MFLSLFWVSEAMFFRLGLGFGVWNFGGLFFKRGRKVQQTSRGAAGHTEWP